MPNDLGGFIRYYWKSKDSFPIQNAVGMGLWGHLLLRATVNKRVLPNGEILNETEVLISSVKFAQDMGISRKVLRRFLDLFEKEGMIKMLKRDRNGTTLSICKYKTYQPQFYEEGQKRNSNGTATEQKRNSNGPHTINPNNPKSPKNPKRKGASPSQPQPTLFEEVISFGSREVDDSFASWVLYKEERREGIKQTSMKGLITRVTNLVKKHGSEAVADSFQQAIASGWQGWEHGLKNGKSSSCDPNDPRGTFAAAESFLNDG